MERVHPSYFKIKTVYKFIFERIFFVLTFMSMFVIMFGIANEFLVAEPPYYVVNADANILFALLAGVILIGFLSLVVFNAIFPNLGIFPMFMSRKYPIYYILFNLSFIVVLLSFYDVTACPYILGGMLLVNIIVLIIWRPYPENIHNVTIVIEQFVVMAALGVYAR